MPEESKKPVMYDVDGYEAVTDALVSLLDSFPGLEEQIKADPESYMDYEGDEAPTDAMVEYANLKIDEYTAQLMEEGLI